MFKLVATTFFGKSDFIMDIMTLIVRLINEKSWGHVTSNEL